MREDETVVYTHADFEFFPGLALHYAGITPPGSDLQCVHAYDPPPERALEEKPKRGQSFIRKGELAPEHAALAEAMRGAKVGYVKLAVALGMSEKTLYYRLRYHNSYWAETYTAAALFVGRPDLLRFVPGAVRP